MEKNQEFDLAWDIVENTSANLFLTGRAGTGKTAFLKMLKESSSKRLVVLAPTGIAAINAGGMTIHSFFQLPFVPFVPETAFSSGGGKYGFRFGKEKRCLLRSLDLLVIDEISMVRADLLDAIDNVMRRYRDRNSPFGGVQLLLIGDLQQLPPVEKEEEARLLREYYDTPYFFSSHALARSGFCMVELQTVYRQKDPVFLHLLNRIRDGRCTEDVLDRLNARYFPDFRPGKDDGYIRLVTHNHQAAVINSAEMETLPGPSFFFPAHIEGTFPQASFPTGESLELKAGAQIMFVKNDSSGKGRYFNGMIGWITALSSDSIRVRGGACEEEFDLVREVWTNARYVLDKDSMEIREEIDGTFRQYPVKLAWAITVHKSQGLTFDKAVIDAGSSFAHGQAYVALSRCRSLDGLVLSTPLTHGAVICDMKVKEFTEDARKDVPDEARLASMRKAYFVKVLSDLFDFSRIMEAISRFVKAAEEYLTVMYPDLVVAYVNGAEDARSGILDVSERFRGQYTRIAASSMDLAADSLLMDRISSGCRYFKDRLKHVRDIFPGLPDLPDGKEARRRLKDAFGELESYVDMKTALLEFVLDNGFDVRTCMKERTRLMLEPFRTGKPHARKKSKENPDVQSVESPGAIPDILHPLVYARLVIWRSREAEARGIPVYAVARRKALLGISNLMPSDKTALAGVPYFGKKSVEKYGDAILSILSEFR